MAMRAHAQGGVADRGANGSHPSTFVSGQAEAASLPTAENAPPNALLVSPRQRGNPLLSHIRHVRWIHAAIVPDYQMGKGTCALYLSLRYHLLNPQYIFFRVRELQHCFRLRILLCHVDLDDVTKPLAEVTKLALHSDCTLICAFSVEECARYLETYKSYEQKPADIIKERTENDYASRLNAMLTTVKGINKTDVITLGSKLGSVAGVMRASEDELAGCPGIGPTKVKRVFDTFHEPFLRKEK